jgi:hypothetical protein
MAGSWQINSSAEARISSVDHELRDDSLARLQIVGARAHDAKSSPTGKSPPSVKTCPVFIAKIFWFSFDPNQSHLNGVSRSLRRGVGHRHERWVRDAVDALASSRGLRADERR